LGRNEKQLVVDAFDELKRNGEWDSFAAIHNDPTNRDYAHGKQGFFVWHRHYLYQFENAMRSLGGRFSCVTLPYWPFEMDAGREANSAIFDFLGSPREMNGMCVNKAPFSNWRTSDGPCVRRTFGRQFSFVGEARVLELIVNTPRHGLNSGFRSLIEGAPHAGVHNYIGGGGGHMGTMASPNDPIFFLLHANVDRLFTIWSDCHNHENRRFTTNAWPDNRGNFAMPYLLNGRTYWRFSTPVTPYSVYNQPSELQPVSYDQNDRMVGLIESTAGAASRCNFNLFNADLSKKRVLAELEESSQWSNSSSGYQPVKFWHAAVQEAYDDICTNEIPDAPKMYQIHATAMAECNICTGGGTKLHASEEWISMSHMEQEHQVFEPICKKGSGVAVGAASKYQVSVNYADNEYEEQPEDNVSYEDGDEDTVHSTPSTKKKATKVPKTKAKAKVTKPKAKATKVKPVYQEEETNYSIPEDNSYGEQTSYGEESPDYETEESDWNDYEVSEDDVDDYSQSGDDQTTYEENDSEDDSESSSYSSYQPTVTKTKPKKAKVAKIKKAKSTY